ncbi:MAG: alpha/beta fold hydrolase [Thermoleophilia bacterium]|nr:alpha/beta fold hydrolase [Thermoleophilia bacterium]
MRDAPPPLILVHGLAGTSGAICAGGATRGLDAIAAPTLLVWGEHDRLVPPATAAAWQAAIPDAKLVALPDAGHVPMHERPDEFNRLARAFLGAV